MFEYLRLRESFATMFFIIWGMMAKLGSFVVILMVVLLAFTSLDFVAFGSSRGRSQAFLSSLISRFQGSLGDVDFESAASLDHDWGMTFLIFFIFVAVLLLLNLLIAVMSEAYEEVKEVAEARWAYVQMEMLVEYEAERASSEKSCCASGCCSGGATRHHELTDDAESGDKTPAGMEMTSSRATYHRADDDCGERKGDVAEEGQAGVARSGESFSTTSPRRRVLPRGVSPLD